jgi:hypothetical protein
LQLCSRPTQTTIRKELGKILASLERVENEQEMTILKGTYKSLFFMSKKDRADKIDTILKLMWYGSEYPFDWLFGQYDTEAIMKYGPVGYHTAFKAVLDEMIHYDLIECRVDHPGVFGTGEPRYYVKLKVLGQKAQDAGGWTKYQKGLNRKAFIDSNFVKWVAFLILISPFVWTFISTVKENGSNEPTKIEAKEKLELLKKSSNQIEIVKNDTLSLDSAKIPLDTLKK